jgi:hypothetical protein
MLWGCVPTRFRSLCKSLGVSSAVDWGNIEREADTALSRLLDVLEPFSADTVIIGQNIDALEASDVTEESKQFWRRALVRLVFSELESLSFQLKQAAFAFRAVPWARFTTGELALLSEQAYSLNKNGTVKVIDAHLPMLPNFRFAVTCFCRVLAPRFTLDVGGQGWEDLTNAVEIRDRITHPKSKEQLFISKSEADMALRGGIWFRESMQRMMRSIDLSEFKKYP